MSAQSIRNLTVQETLQKTDNYYKCLGRSIIHKEYYDIETTPLDAFKYLVVSSMDRLLQSCTDRIDEEEIINTLKQALSK